MIKNIICSVISLFILNFSFLPAYAIQENTENVNNTVDTYFVSDFNINKSTKKQVIQFRSKNHIKIHDTIIPKGTLFNGKIVSMKKSRFPYRRAKARIIITEMVFPTGEKYNINAETKRSVLKGSAIGNTAKGIITAPFALVLGVTGGVIIVVETVSIIGILLVGPTAECFKGIIGKLARGVNYTKNDGDEIDLKIKQIKTSSLNTTKTEDAELKKDSDTPEEE